MFCVKCGAEVNEGQDTCPKCGVRLEKPEASDKPGAPTARPSRRAIVIGVAAVAVFSLYLWCWRFWPATSALLGLVWHEWPSS